MTEASKPRILLLSGYDAASHRRWRRLLTDAMPDIHWHTLALPARYFRWRIRGNALSWLDEPCLQEPWDLVLATSMVDLAALKGLNPQLARTPCVLYMHENQFAFPVSGNQRDSVEPQMVNLYGALAADRVLFNSDWNRTSFLEGTEAFLRLMPDAVPEGVVGRIDARSSVLPVPIDDHLFTPRSDAINTECPHLLWNHRWEYDKGPERLLRLVQALDRRGQRFRLSVVGERFRSHPKALDRLREQFPDRIAHWGFLPDRADYDHLLRTADIVVSTALHDFQGLSMLEAMAAGCLPLAPNRLAYREYVPADCRYDSQEDNPEAEAEAAADTLQRLLREPPPPCPPEAWRASGLVPGYRALFNGLIDPEQPSPATF